MYISIQHKQICLKEKEHKNAKIKKHKEKKKITDRPIYVDK